MRIMAEPLRIVVRCDGDPKPARAGEHGDQIANAGDQTALVEGGLRIDKRSARYGRSEIAGLTGSPIAIVDPQWQLRSSKQPTGKSHNAPPGNARNSSKVYERPQPHFLIAMVWVVAWIMGRAHKPSTACLEDNSRRTSGK